MRLSAFVVGIMLLAPSAFAAAPTYSVPEMDVGAGFAAIALLAGAAAVIRERSRRK